MTGFAPTVTEFWRVPFQGTVIHEDPTLRVVANGELDESERITVLTTDGRTSVALRPEIAASFGEIVNGGGLTEEVLREHLVAAGIVLHGADEISYLSVEERASVLAEQVPADVRLLGPDDAARFAEFQAAVSEQDLDDAQVELDDWAVLAVIAADGRILSAGSMYPWQSDSMLADIGVLTRADARGQGHARRLVRAMCRHALDAGYEPQYRCQWDNTGSIALARSAGLTLFGSWQIVTPDGEDG